MNVLQINNNHHTIGGSDTVYFNTGALLADAGHDVSFFAGQSPKDLPAADAEYFPSALDTKNAGLSDIARYFYNVDARRKMLKMIADKGPFDVAHLHIYYGRITSAILAPLKKAGTTLIQSTHEYKLISPNYTLERNGTICQQCAQGNTLHVLRNRCKDNSLSRSILSLAEFHISRLLGDVRLMDRFICVSHFQRKLFADAGIPEEKLVTLHNFVDPEALQPATPTTRGEHLLYFGRIEKLKGIDTLLAATQAAGVKLKIAGVGATQDEVERVAAERDDVEFLGFVSGEPLRRLVAEAKAVMVPSEWFENCPMTVLEAKAVGTPVIGARIGGIPELIRDGIDGYLHEPGDVNGLTEAIEKLNNADFDALSKAAYQDVQDHYSPKAHLAALMDIYLAAGAK